MQTQHQFMFEAVEPHETFFPKGVKVTYRAYSKDDVIEIVSGPHSTYENVNVYPQSCRVKTFPEAVMVADPHDSSKQKEIAPAGNFRFLNSRKLSQPHIIGMFLLHKLPDVKEEDVKFVQFKAGSRKIFDDCLDNLKTFCGGESSQVKVWQEWEKVFIPKTNEVEDYIKFIKEELPQVAAEL